MNNTVQVTNLDIIKGDSPEDITTISKYKEDNSAFTGMDKIMIHSNASDKSSLA